MAYSFTFKIHGSMILAMAIIWTMLDEACDGMLKNTLTVSTLLIVSGLKQWPV